MTNVRIAVQGKGRMADKSLEFLYSLGVKFTANGRNCIAKCDNYDLDVLFLRDDDIPKYVERGVADFGIVGENVVLEQNSRVKILKKLNFCFCSLVIAVLKNSRIMQIDDLEGRRIATSYPDLLKAFLEEKRIEADVFTLDGSVEIVPSLDLADAICDLTQTGKTLRDNGLKPIATILDSQAVLIQSPFLTNRAIKAFELLFSGNLLTNV